MQRFVIRRSGWHPRSTGKSYAVAVGPQAASGRPPAAWYRVTGAPQDSAEVDALASRLVAWLGEVAGDPMGSRCPASVRGSGKSARIVCTKAGRAAGFLGPSGRTRGRLPEVSK